MIKRKNNNSMKKKNPPPPLGMYQNKKNVLSTLGESMMWGTGLGFGSEAGHSIFRKMFERNQNTNLPNPEHIPNSSCTDIRKLYEKCLMSNSFEQHKCDFLKEDINKFCRL